MPPPLTNYAFSLSCESQKCLLSECWNTTVGDSAIITKIPTYIPMPVQVNPDKLPVLLRHKRDFGITAAIIAAIAASAAAATAAAVALTTLVQTAATFNNVTGMVAEALAMQEQINGHLHAGILIVNQRVDLVQERLDILESIVSIGCIHNMAGLCITPIAHNNLSLAANLSRQLGNMLNGTWTRQFQNLTRQLRAQIISINATKVPIASVSEWLKMVQQSVSFLKQWAGLGSLAILLVLANVLMVRWICSLGRRQRRQQQLMAQAMMALEAGTSPQIWLSMLDW
uniref:Retroviral envelope protein GP41-like domain-containing protein n=1 Tax=Mustela putorius furo TaxID=9669 RepID=M3Z4E0_MUSPF